MIIKQVVFIKRWKNHSLFPGSYKRYNLKTERVQLTVIFSVLYQKVMQVLLYLYTENDTLSHTVMLLLV